MKVTKLGVLATARPGTGGTDQCTLSMPDTLRHVNGVAVTLYGEAENPDPKALGFPITGFSEPYTRQLRVLAADRLHIGLHDSVAARDVQLAPIYSLSLLQVAPPFAYALHDLQELYRFQNSSSFPRLWRHQIYRRLSTPAARIICASEYVKAYIGRLPAPLQSASLIRQSNRQLEKARSRMKLSLHFLVYPEHFWPHKNHLRLTESFREVAPDVPDLGLVLPGKDQEGAAATQAIEACRREKVVHFAHVAQDQLLAISRLATALVMPSLFESISIPIYEALQAGAPAAASGLLAISSRSVMAAFASTRIRCHRSNRRSLRSSIIGRPRRRARRVRGWRQSGRRTTARSCRA